MSYKKRILNNELEIPTIGFGTWRLNDQEVEKAISDALNAGYRYIDTAAYYDNELGVGQAIRKSTLNRDEIFVATKCWHEDAGYENVMKAFNESLERLGLDYIDLYLIHWPTLEDESTWKAFEDLYKSKKVRAIGVCNYNQNHLEHLLTHAEIKPMVNQVEHHPLNQDQDLKDFCNRHNILMQAWAPLARTEIFSDQDIVQIAARHKKTPAQVILRWQIQKNYMPIPKSAHAVRIKENIEIFDFTLSQEEVAIIDDKNKNQRVGGYPDYYDGLKF